MVWMMVNLYENYGELKMKEVTEVRVHVSGCFVVCPHCENHVDGWYTDPRGCDTKCDFCDKIIKIHKEADLEIY